MSEVENVMLAEARRTGAALGTVLAYGAGPMAEAIAACRCGSASSVQQRAVVRLLDAFVMGGPDA